MPPELVRVPRHADDSPADGAARLRNVTRQNKHLTAVIRKFLTTDALTAAHRQELISVLAGLKEGRGPAYPLHAELSDAEVRLVRHFRTLPPTGRRVVSLLVRQLAKKGGG
jgi:hypothetical protein